MNHYTMNTGNNRWSPRSEVSDDMIALMLVHVATALDRPTRIPGSRLTARAVIDDAGMLVTVREPDNGPIVVSFVVIREDGPFDKVWAMLGGPDNPAAQQGIPGPPKPGPWCLATVFPAFRPEHAWLGDYERCVAWAWLDPSEQVREGHTRTVPPPPPNKFVN